MTENDGTPSDAARLRWRASRAISATDLNPSVIARLRSLAETHGEDECWPWRWARTLPGYGNVALRRLGRNIGAHVAAYALAFGCRPDGAVIMHSCDNPPCCNPQHLYAVTQAENLQDAVRKSRLYCTTGRPFRRLGKPVLAPDGRSWPSTLKAAEELGLTHSAVAHRCRIGWRGWRYSS